MVTLISDFAAGFTEYVKNPEWEKLGFLGKIAVWFWEFMLKIGS